MEANVTITFQGNPADIANALLAVGAALKMAPAGKEAQGCEHRQADTTHG